MTHNPSRKQFVARLLGAVAGASVLPKLLAKPTVSEPRPGKASEGAKRGFEVRHDSRVVARRDTV